MRHGSLSPEFFWSREGTIPPVALALPCHSAHIGEQSLHEARHKALLNKRAEA